MITALKKNDTTLCFVTFRRISRDVTPSSEVWEHVLITTLK